MSTLAWRMHHYFFLDMMCRLGLVYGLALSRVPRLE
jgi:hypothetical protein